MRQHDETTAILARSAVVAQRRLKAARVLVPDPAATGRLQLRAAGTEEVQASARVEVVRDLVGGVGLAVDDPAGKVEGGAGVVRKVDDGGDGVTGL